MPDKAPDMVRVRSEIVEKVWAAAEDSPGYPYIHFIAKSDLCIDKKSAMARINEHVGCQLLKPDNTRFANVNSAKKDVWWVNVPLDKFRNELHLVLVKDGGNGLVWLRVAPGSISAPEDMFRVRKDKGYVDLEISSLPERYLKDVKSGGKEYDFTRHVEYEWVD